MQQGQGKVTPIEDPSGQTVVGSQIANSGTERGDRVREGKKFLPEEEYKDKLVKYLLETSAQAQELLLILFFEH